MNELLQQLLHQLMTNTALQGATLALIVKILTTMAEKVDKMPKDAQAIKLIHTVLLALSALMTLGTDYINGTLSSINIAAAIQFIQVYLTSLGTHTAIKAFHVIRTDDKLRKQ